MEFAVPDPGRELDYSRSATGTTSSAHVDDVAYEWFTSLAMWAADQ